MSRSTPLKTCFVAIAPAGALVLAWLSLLVWFKPAPIVDEQYHWSVVRQLAELQWPKPDALPMFPGYHLLVSAITWLSGPSLTACRCASAAMTLVSLILATLIVVQIRCIVTSSPSDLRPAGFEHASRSSFAPETYALTGPLLYICSNPLWFPYSALVYTENAATVFLLASLLLALRRRAFAAAALLGASCLIRQSNVIWSLLFPVLIGIDAWRRRELATCTIEPREQFIAAFRTAMRIGWPFLAVFAAVAVVGFLRPDVLQSTISENQPRFNRAQYYGFALAVVLLGLPIGLMRFRDSWRALRSYLFHPLIPAGIIAAAGVLEIAFDNPHAWNGDLNYLRNWPLVYMSLSSILRFGLSLLIVLAVIAGGIWIRRQPNRAALLSILAVSLLYLGPHALVEPRYYIVPTLLFSLFVDFSPVERRALIAWNLTLCASVCAFILLRGNLEGGIW